MKQFLLWTFAGIALAGSACASAPSDTPASYSHTIALHVKNRGGLVQLRLPKDVYLQARSAALDDLRVFDSQGQAVPFALTMPAKQRGIQRRTTSARVFSLSEYAVTTTGTLAVRTRPDGTLLSVESRVGAAAPGATLAGLLIDIGQPAPERPMFDALVFTAPPGETNYSARVTLEASDDLQEWSSVAEGRLDWLSNSASDTLANNRIAFTPRNMRYVRVRWVEGTPRMFGAIAAEREESEAVPYAPDTMLVAAQPGAFPGDLVYPIGRAVPLRSIGMQLTETGTVVPCEIGRYIEVPAVPGAAAARSASRWQFALMLRTTFYNIMQDGAVRMPADLTIDALSVDRLVIRPSTAFSGQPALRIGWLPATLIFAARDAGPYTLAVGRDGAGSVQRPLSDVAPGYKAQELLAIDTATTGQVAVRRVGPEEPSQAARAGLSATARTAVLWSVLLLGVIVLGFLSWRLATQSNAKRNDTPDADGPPL